MLPILNVVSFCFRGNNYIGACRLAYNDCKPEQPHFYRLYHPHSNHKLLSNVYTNPFSYIRLIIFCSTPLYIIFIVVGKYYNLSIVSP